MLRRRDGVPLDDRRWPMSAGLRSDRRRAKPTFALGCSSQQITKATGRRCLDHGRPFNASDNAAFIGYERKRGAGAPLGRTVHPFSMTSTPGQRGADIAAVLQCPSPLSTAGTFQDSDHPIRTAPSAPGHPLDRHLQRDGLPYTTGLSYHHCQAE